MGANLSLMWNNYLKGIWYENTRMLRKNYIPYGCFEFLLMFFTYSMHDLWETSVRREIHLVNDRTCLLNERPPSFFKKIKSVCKKILNFVGKVAITGVSVVAVALLFYPALIFDIYIVLPFDIDNDYIF